jgi:hypothetical protein
MSIVELRCATQSREGGADPAGTAAAADAFLLVEVPLPWPKEITDHHCLAGASDLGGRVQGVVPSEATATTGEYAVTLYRRGGSPFVRYERREVRGPIDQIAAMCRSVIDAPPDDTEVHDVLVCTHGSRDRCCGSLGTALFFAAARPPGVRMRRTSHTGGHRFAPTAVLLPEGTAWAWLDEELLSRIVNRSGDVGDVLPHYRGSTALTPPAVQVAEGQVFARVGWQWLDTSRWGEVVDEDEDRTAVRIDSEIGSWRAVVERVGTRPQPLCGVPPGSEKKADDELAVVELAELAT